MRKENDKFSHPCLMTHPACQQNLRGCRATLDHRPQMFFMTLSLFHLICGILIISTSVQVKEYKVRYDNQCEGTGDTTVVTFDNPEIPIVNGKNVFLYYELHGFYQAHFRFGSSFSPDQMHGRYVESTADCDPVNLPKNNPNKTKLLAPCGLMPMYFFTDYYEPSQNGFEESGIIWSHEFNLYKPLNSKYTAAQRWMDSISGQFPNETLNEHFINWMRVSPQPTFRKLFMRTTDSVEKVGKNLQVKVYCNYDKTTFQGERWLVLLKPNTMGGHNEFLAYANFGLFALLLIFAMTFMFSCSCVNREDHPIGLEANCPNEYSPSREDDILAH